MTKIAIDLRMIDSSGIGTYLRNLIPKIIAQNQNFQFVLIGNRLKIAKYFDVFQNIKIIENDSVIYSIQEQIQWLKILPNDLDLLWSPHFDIPFFYAGKLVVTVHDLFHLAMPEYVEGLPKKMYVKLMFDAVRRNSNAILTVSEFSKNELIRLLGIDSSKITVTYNGVDQRWFAIQKELNFNEGPYILYVGNVKPHKNLINLLSAFSKIKDDLPHKLIIVGKKEGFITGDNLVFQKADQLTNRVVFTGYINQAELEQYYIHADALVFPSLYEGFGLPPLEAMACGCPVIVSNLASLPEVCGDAAVYCDPYNIKDIALKIKNLLVNQTLQQRLRVNGLKRAGLFTWEKCAVETWRVIEGVLKE